MLPLNSPNVCRKWSTSGWNWKGTSSVQCCIRPKDSTSWKLRDGNPRWCWAEGSFNATKLPHSLSANDSHMLQLSVDLPPFGDLSLQIATSQKDSFTIFCHSSPDAKSIPYTLAGLSSAHISLQNMDDVPENIIINVGITHSKNDSSTMTFLSTESNHQIGSREVIYILPSKWMNLEVWHEGVGWSSLHKYTKKWNE